MVAIRQKRNILSEIIFHSVDSVYIAQIYKIREKNLTCFTYLVRFLEKKKTRKKKRKSTHLTMDKRNFRRDEVYNKL